MECGGNILSEVSWTDLHDEVASLISSPPKVVAVFDDSGSISDSDYDHMVSVADKLMGALVRNSASGHLPCGTLFFYEVGRQGYTKWDTDILRKCLRKREVFQLAPILDKMHLALTAKDVLVVFTDGFVECPVRPPQCQVVWAVLSELKDEAIGPFPYGKVCYI